MNNIELFESKKKEIESSFEEFDEFYSKMDEFFKKKEVSQDEIEIISQIHLIVEELDKGKTKEGFVSLNGDDLTRSDYKLSQYLLSLGEIASQKAQKANTMGRWVKWKRHNEWNPAKQHLEDKLKEVSEDAKKRIIKEDIESEVSKRIFADSIIESMMAGHADLLLNIYDSTRSVLTALAHRINLKRQEREINK